MAKQLFRIFSVNHNVVANAKIIVGEELWNRIDSECRFSTRKDVTLRSLSNIPLANDYIVYAETSSSVLMIRDCYDEDYVANILADWIRREFQLTCGWVMDYCRPLGDPRGCVDVRENVPNVRCNYVVEN